MPNIPPPPPDLSGGVMVLQYTNGVDTHRQRLHIAAFSETNFTSPTDALEQSDNGQHHYAYADTSGLTGTEKGLADTFTNYGDVWKGFYPAEWHLSLTALYRVVNNVSTEVGTLPVVAPIAGTAVQASFVDQRRASENGDNMKTAGGHRGRVVLIAPTGSNSTLVPPQIVTPTTGANPVDQALIAYVAGPATAIVGHDGTKFSAVAHLTGGVNRRLRRRYGFS